MFGIHKHSCKIKGNRSHGYYVRDSYEYDGLEETSPIQQDNEIHCFDIYCRDTFTECYWKGNNSSNAVALCEYPAY